MKENISIISDMCNRLQGGFLQSPHKKFLSFNTQAKGLPHRDEEALSFTIIDFNLASKYLI
ncbi:MAG: hypothetical protein II123_05275 [Lachnospiraceae bacterium]|nr:hypothetical protein [Lachnospiraceae bacterium]